MALSNWFILAWDNDGKPLLEYPPVESEMYKVRIYKNWLYIYPVGDEPHNKRIVTVYSGKLELHYFTIYAKRGRQGSIYAVVSLMKFDAEDNYHGTENYYYIAGYNYNDIPDDYTPIGCEVETVEDYKKWVKHLNEEELVHLPDFEPAIYQNQGDLIFNRDIGLPKRTYTVGVDKPETTYLGIALGMDEEKTEE
jgi:hypothetical protein